MIREHVVESASGEYTRRAWFLPNLETQPTRLLLFLDAEFYLNRMNILPALPASFASLFVSHEDSESRHYDYTCNARYADFIANEVVPWARDLVPSLSTQSHTICGLSLSGLEAAFISLTHPKIFPRAICQSPSFWWNDEWLSSQVHRLSSEHGRFWLSVGDKETEAGVSHAPTGLRQDVSQRDSVERGANKLRETGHLVHFQVFEGGHEMAPWERELPRALAWIGSP